jgi:hypothetical protein
MRKRLEQPRQALDAPGKKAFFAFIPGVAYDLEGLGAEAGQIEMRKRLAA